jgi:ActR/RegA family two-component response regulator
VTDATRVLILADDLIWADRLARATTATGSRPMVVATRTRFEAELPSAAVAIVDLTSQAYDGLVAIGLAAGSGVRVLAVGQHDDHVLRKRALAAGAERVLAYRKLFEDGPNTIAAFVARGATAPA